jgi:hypothetical protein
VWKGDVSFRVLDEAPDSCNHVFHFVYMSWTSLEFGYGSAELTLLVIEITVINVACA